jgi:splicing factor 3B subunit 5
MVAKDNQDPRFSIHAQMEHLQSKYQGTGHADTTKWEWATNIHRDTMASHVGHYNRLVYFSVVENEPIARVRFNCLQAMVQPCGKPPALEEDE